MAAVTLAPEALFHGNGSTNTQLNPHVTHDPAASETSHNRYALLWKVAAIASVVAFIALATGGIIFASLYAEAYLPVVTILAFYPGMSLSLIPVKYCWIKAQDHLADGKINHDINQHLCSLKDSEIASRIGSFVTPGIEAKKLKSVFAQFLELRDRRDAYTERARKIGKADGEVSIEVNGEMTTVKTRDYETATFNILDTKEKIIYAKIQEARKEIYELQEKAALCNLQAAYLLRVMEKPSEPKPLNELVTLINVPYEMRLIAEDGGDGEAFALLKNPATGRAFEADYLNTSTADVAREVFNVRVKTN